MASVQDTSRAIPVGKMVFPMLYLMEMEMYGAMTCQVFGVTFIVGFASPARSEHFLTASLDGTMRIWDMKLGLGKM